MTQKAPLMLSVSGMRGIVGRSLTPVVAVRYAAALGTWLRGESGADAPHVVIGRDSRPSGPMIECAAVAGLLSAGCRVTRLGVVSTPGVAVTLGALGADGGMVITASHNPLPWNGIKPLRRDGVAPPPDQAQEIIRRFREDDVQQVGADSAAACADDPSAAQRHVDAVLAAVPPAKPRSPRLRAVVDSVCGAGGAEARLLLEAMGVELIPLHDEPTGRFPHPPEPTREHLAGLCEAVRDHRADVGFAQDPDADRLAIVDEAGRYIGEEYTLALCAKALLGPGGVAAANLSTSRMIDDVAQAVGGRVVRTPVGEANVAQGMRDHGAAVGGEGNGGIVLAAVSQVRDSLVGMAVVLNLLTERAQPLSQLVGEIPRYAMVKDKLPLEGCDFADVARRLTTRYADAQVDTQDGVRIDWPGRWVHVRPSNTEPIVRVIAEAGDEARARELVAQVKRDAGLG